MEPYFTIREVFYRKNGKPYLHSQEDQAPGGDTIDELRHCLTMMLFDTYRHPEPFTDRQWKKLTKKNGS